MDYRLTGGPELTVRVRVNQPRALTRAVNVVGTVVGTEFPNEWVILGAHYDPWGFGAIDPNGGTASFLITLICVGIFVSHPPFDVSCGSHIGLSMSVFVCPFHLLITGTLVIMELSDHIEITFGTLTMYG